MPEDYFGEDVAARYDEGLGSYGDPAAIQRAVDFLAELAGDGPALEFAIGTGRIALPLAARGVPVHGIDLSGAMVERLRAKPGGEAMPVALGDYATTCVDGTFTLVYLLFNTINNQTTQEGQLATFANAAAHLATDGCFVVEVGVPGLAPLEIFDLGDTHVGIDERHPGTQRFLSHHFTLVDGRWVRNSIPFRAASPGELDLMARLGGMELRERWSGWNREPFTAESTQHVSVWRKS